MKYFRKMNEKNIEKILCNPFYATNIDINLCIKHKSLISKKEWIQKNVKLIKKLGEEKYLKRLLEVLQGGYL